jgi:hypothetical protein
VVVGHWTTSAAGGSTSRGHDETGARCGAEAKERRMEPGTTGATEGEQSSGGSHERGNLGGGDAALQGDEGGGGRQARAWRRRAGAWCRLGAHTRVLIGSSDQWLTVDREARAAARAGEQRRRPSTEHPEQRPEQPAACPRSPPRLRWSSFADPNAESRERASVPRAPLLVGSRLRQRGRSAPPRRPVSGSVRLATQPAKGQPRPGPRLPEGQGPNRPRHNRTMQ